MIHILFRDELFEELEKSEFEKLIKEHYLLELEYVNHYNFKQTFYKQKSTHEIKNKGIAFVMLEREVLWAFLYESSNLK